jgi:hypothetical protein
MVLGEWEKIKIQREGGRGVVVEELCGRGEWDGCVERD